MALEPLNLTPIRHEMMASQPSALAPASKREITIPPNILQSIYAGHFKGAQMNRLTMDWAISILSADQELFSDLRRLRARSRALAKNNHYAAKFLRQVEKNVIGDCGITLQAKVKMQRGDKLNDKINEAIEDAWADWSEPEYCCVDGKLARAAAECFFMRNVAMDGEVFIRKVPLPGNPYLFALQFIDPDQVDPTFFIQRLPNGNEIRMGVEVDQFQRPVAYYIWDRHPSEYGANPNQRRRIPATEILHRFIPLRINQTRGIPWMAPSMFEMNMLGGYKEAEVIAARVSACKMGFFSSQTGEEYTGDSTLAAQGVDASLQPGMGPQLMDATPGALESIGTLKFTPWDPQHPNSSYDAFCKGALRGIASGLDVSYHSLGNDLEGVNFSSIRAGLLDERDTWKLLQKWVIASFCVPVFRAWLPNAILAGALDLDPSSIGQYQKQVKWHGRGWDWVDPLKDVTAAALAIQNGLSNHTRELAESGEDLEDTWNQLADEKELAAELNLTLGTDIKGVADTASDDQQDNQDGQDAGSASSSASGGKKKPAGKQQKKELADLLRAIATTDDSDKLDDLAVAIAGRILKK